MATDRLRQQPAANHPRHLPAPALGYRRQPGQNEAVAKGSGRRLGQGTGPVAETCGATWNDVLLLVLSAVLLAASVYGTFGLNPGALFWPLFAGMAAYTYARWRDQVLVEAHLDGTVLTVQRRDRTHSCDLTATRTVRLGTNITAGGDEAFDALSVRDARTGDRVRYVLRTDDGHALTGEDLRLLAGALEATPPSTPSHADAHPTAARLRRIADGAEKSASETVDWSHRIRTED
ncbi:MAG TPA: hypothetical protein VHJ17_23755 [Thermomonospora sp.]|nr:hypothetical protein [Thermomonospora sp.]